MKHLVFCTALAVSGWLAAATNPIACPDSAFKPLFERLIGPTWTSVEQKKLPLAKGVDKLLESASKFNGTRAVTGRRLVLESAFALAVQMGDYEKAVYVLNILQHWNTEVSSEDVAALLKKLRVVKSAKTQPVFDYLVYLDVARKMTPKVVRIEPADGAQGVDPKTDKIVITFDRPMRSGCSFCRGEDFSWNQFPASNAEDAPRPKWNDDHTQVTITAALRPGTAYHASVNSGNARNFRDWAGTPVPDTPYSFTTAGTFAPDPAWPKIVRVEPANGATDVDPDLKAIVVTFDREMQDGSWSVCRHKDGTWDDYPKTAGRFSYDETHRTLTIPVKLVPDKTYKLQFNNGGACAFQTPDSHCLEDYPYTFTTRK